MDRDSLILGGVIGFALPLLGIVFYIYIRNRFLTEIGVE